MALNFQRIVLFLALIALVIICVIAAYAMKQHKSEAAWPPVVGDCPDYWVDLSGNGAACFNSHRLGKCNLPTEDGKNTMDFTAAAFTGSDGDCAKYKWADACKVTWDGITYGVKNPCDDDDDEEE